jgi:hypothetical protein
MTQATALNGFMVSSALQTKKGDGGIILCPPLPMIAIEASNL